MFNMPFPQGKTILFQLKVLYYNGVYNLAHYSDNLILVNSSLQPELKIIFTVFLTMTRPRTNHLNLEL